MHSIIVSAKVRFGFLIVLMILVFGQLVGPAAARTFTIDGTCSLADAITAANTNSATGGCPSGSVFDDIVLTADITLSSALPVITTRIDIEGENFEINGSGSYRIFEVSSTGDLTIENLTLRNGDTSGDGGAILVASGGDLTVRDSVFEDNDAGDEGGAIYAGAGTLADGGRVEIDRTLFDNNDADDDGGAIKVRFSRLVIEDSTFTNNSADGFGGAIAVDEHNADISDTVFEDNHADARGGAIWTQDGSRLDVERSVFVQNSTDFIGGAIAIASDADDLDIENSTFSNNSADDRGSAIHAIDSDVDLYHVTIVGNSSATLFHHIDSGMVEVENSILYNLGTGAACEGVLDENYNTIIEDGSCDNPASLSVNPSLGEFTDGYYPLLPGSPAINAAVRRCRSHDQRRVSRPQGGGCDIGAYEFGNGSSLPSRTSRPQPLTGRPNTKNEQTVAHNQRVIDEHGYGVTTQYGLQTIALQPLNPQDCGAIGSQAVCDMDVLDVADVTGHVQQGVRFCFKQYGRVLFMPSHDANGHPIDHKTTPPETLPADHVDGMTCVTINRTGKLVLVYAEPPVAAEQQAPAPVWQPVPVTQCGEERADGSVVHVVQSGHHCWAIAEACGIFMEDIQQLNPEFGDCRMLHPGDELVIRAPFVVQTAVYEVVELAGPAEEPEVEVVETVVEEIPYDDPEYMAMEARVLLAVARCRGRLWSGFLRSPQLPWNETAVRIITDEAWRNRGSDHWAAQLGDGRLTVHRPWVRNQAGRKVFVYSPECTAISEYVLRSYPHGVSEHRFSEVIKDGSIEALTHAIADMLRGCEVPYAVAEREAPKIVNVAVQNGVRGVQELPAFRALYFNYWHDTDSILESEAFEQECFLVPDDTGLDIEKWARLGDKDQLFNEKQIEDSLAQLEAIKKWGVALCDIGASAGTSGALQAGIASKEFAMEVAKEVLKEVALHAAKEGAASLYEASVDEKGLARQQIADDFREKAIRLIPTGPCSFVMALPEYAQLRDEMEQALANLQAGFNVRDLEVFGEDSHCKIYSLDPVLAKRDPDPNKDASELRLDASDAFSPLATIKHNGEKYYVVLGTSGRGTQYIGGLATAALYNDPENHGHAFVPVSDINATDSCTDLLDVTHLYNGAALPQDMIGRNLVDLNIQEVPNAYANEDCKFSMDIDPDQVYSWHLREIDPESMHTGFSVFRLCETYEVSSCRSVLDDNEFVITHYDRRNRRVYVKSLDDDGKPEGWLVRANLSQSFIESWLGRRPDQPYHETQHWVDPNHFNPENVVNETGGSRNFGNPAMCLPQHSQ